MCHCRPQVLSLVRVSGILKREAILLVLPVKLTSAPHLIRYFDLRLCVWALLLLFVVVVECDERSKGRCEL